MCYIFSSHNIYSQDVLPVQICFHAQQAVEKAFKAVLLFHKINFPFTHDLEELIDTFETSKIPIPSNLLDVGILTPYAVETRYPGYWGEITETDISEAIKFAEDAIKWTEGIVQEKEQPPPLTSPENESTD
ncbi:MAG: HEPN domain-containing protein [Nitrospirae bacterium]|nr:HEPN domain-containing protein [Nitrospirota bacterium]